MECRIGLGKREKWPGLGKGKRVREGQGDGSQGVEEPVLPLQLAQSMASRLPMPFSVKWGETSDSGSGGLGMSRPRDVRETWGAPMHSSMAQGGLPDLPKNRCSWEYNGGTWVFWVWIRMILVTSRDHWPETSWKYLGRCQQAQISMMCRGQCEQTHPGSPAEACFPKLAS